MKKIAVYLKPYWLFAVISPIMMMGEVLADLLQPKLMSVIVDCGILGGGDVTSSSTGRLLLGLFYGSGTSYSPMQVITSVGGVMLALVAVGGFFGTFCAYTAARAAQYFGHDLRCSVYRRVMSLSVEQTDRFTTGSLVTRMTNDITAIIDFIEMILRMFVRAPVFFIGGAIMLFTQNLSFGSVILCALPVLAVLIYFILRRATPLFTTVQTKLDKVNSVVQENVGGARVVKAFVREEYENGRFDKANAELRDTNWRVLMLLAVMSPVLNIVMNASVAAIILIGGLKAGVGGVSVGSIMASVTYVTQVLMSVMMVTMMFQSVSRSIASGKRVIEVLDTEPVIVSGSADRPSAEVQVSFRKVEFRYPGTAGSPVLRDINLDIRRGETLAVIGSTGTGKSTLINLIPRFYDATGGSILVNGLDVKDYDIKKLRKKIGFVMQKSELFSETIANNIRWGKPDADDTELKEAAETAQAAEFIGSFADGFGTLVAEKGASLSGGQKQRLSIARALVRKPDILILDDCTSALDLATEAKLQQALRRRLKNTTVIMIAQRIASVKNADRIAVIEDGTIRDCAPHDELLRVSAAYRDIYSSQMGTGALNGKEAAVNE
ncbi:MAG TPA: ABC transporter ATP-binding protein [Clostridiales bacterium]|nr:MAG: putative multidrug export ATP-binding/permease protein [Firmicutes bacterium ADurb.Bin262]HQH63146.1 ABC transporter ATP-binding protein [Clostridiales bacterium]HQK72155.1 ABC transporter ATP-binding protein [Clostridiales bacterium]